MIISCNGANFVARPLGYAMTGGWMQGDAATNDWYRPVETFQRRFRELVCLVRSLGFGALDLWTAELNWAWATDAHLALARAVLREEGVAVTSYAGPFGDTPQDFAKACRLITSLGCDLLGGSTGLLQSDPQALVSLLGQHGVRFAFENHPAEKSPADVLRRIGRLDAALVGACVDTGWFGTNGCDAAAALRELYPRLFLVHLKDVRERGAHRTCRYGEGIVPVKACLDLLVERRFAGPVSVEHEPEDFDPAEDLRANLRDLRDWGVQA